jgi:hypothetical protein
MNITRNGLKLNGIKGFCRCRAATEALDPVAGLANRSPPAQLKARKNAPRDGRAAAVSPISRE